MYLNGLTVKSQNFMQFRCLFSLAWYRKFLVLLQSLNINSTVFIKLAALKCAKILKRKWFLIKKTEVIVIWPQKQKLLIKTMRTNALSFISFVWLYSVGAVLLIFMTDSAVCVLFGLLLLYINMFVQCPKWTQIGNEP